MNKLITIILCIACGACSSLTKFGEKRYFKQKVINNLNGQHVTQNIMYYSTRDDDDSRHCFESNPDNKEIITVNSNYLEFAIDHFYKRVSKINVRHVSSLSKVSVKVIATEEVDFELEMASCFHSYGSRVTLPVDPVTYTSFRLKN